MRLTAYVRVSTDLQAEQGMGLDIQRRGIRAWAKANGHRIVSWYSDEGISGSNGIDTRNGLHQALAAIKPQKGGKPAEAQGLVVYRLDRLARKLEVQESTLERIWASDASAFAVDLGEIPKDDPDDPTRAAIRQMIGVFAQLERGMIAARLRAGRRLKAERGGYAGGAPSYGQKASGGRLVPDAAEQATVARIKELHHQGLGSRPIADALNGEGRTAKRGGAWTSAQVCRVLRSLEGAPAVAN